METNTKTPTPEMERVRNDLTIFLDMLYAGEPVGISYHAWSVDGFGIQSDLIGGELDALP